jgi:hypothetical protein
MTEVPKATPMKTIWLFPFLHLVRIKLITDHHPGGFPSPSFPFLNASPTLFHNKLKIWKSHTTEMNSTKQKLSFTVYGQYFKEIVYLMTRGPTIPLMMMNIVAKEYSTIE